jgi:preprotein translocase subunit SecF
MNQKNLIENKRKYDTVRHHAWAGSVLLTVLVAFRGFLEITDINLDDRIIVIIGIVLIIYILVSVFFTYKYRSGLSAEQKSVEIHINSKNAEKEKIAAELEKERLKVEKKRAKAEAKKIKKTDKK